MATLIGHNVSRRLIGAESGLDAKVAFLSNPAHYPEPASCVEVVATHMSYVFLSDRYAYKLKRPIRNADVDLRTVSARQSNCAAEVMLNRRLTSNVYLGVVPLYSSACGELTFGDGAEVADWLVKMRRLPSERMLDRRIRNDTVARTDIDAVVARLCEFYRSCPRIGVIASEYREQFHDDIIANCMELCEPEYAIAAPSVDWIAEKQLAMIASNGALFDARVHDGRIVEGHGDLRPEHICLETPPQVIDCLEFSRVLRTLDVIDELGYLALECERLGAPQLRAQLLQAYRGRSGDSPPEALVHFYQSHRACLRATLALRHLHEPRLANRADWQSRAYGYLALARTHAEHFR